MVADPLSRQFEGNEETENANSISRYSNSIRFEAKVFPQLTIPRDHSLPSLPPWLSQEDYLASIKNSKYTIIYSFLKTGTLPANKALIGRIKNLSSQFYLNNQNLLYFLDPQPRLVILEPHASTPSEVIFRKSANFPYYWTPLTLLSIVTLQSTR